MKICLSLLFSWIVYQTGAAQSIDADPGCREKCNHAFTQARGDRPSYYQYPSMDNYDIKYEKLDLHVEAGNNALYGTALTVAKAVATMDSFNIELRNNMTVDSIFVNGIRSNFSRGIDYIFIPLSPALPAGSMINVLFYYQGTPTEGVYNGTIGNGLPFTATLSESYQARGWFPAKQVLQDKIDSADIWISTASTNKVGSNGLLVNVADSPNNKKQYQWKTRYPMSYYMPCFSVSNYLEYINYAKPSAFAPDSIPVIHYVANDDAYFNTIQPNLDKTPAFIEAYSDLFGLYPFSNEKYGHSQASIGGGMEHQTMSTVSNFGTTLIAHELAHQWWGDNVTCATWNDIWLNEGFASYSEYLAIERLPALFPTTNPPAYMQAIHDNVMSVPNGSVYVPGASTYDENRIFSGRLSYNKGSAIIHTLRFEMEDDALFFQALRNYQVAFKDSVASAADFQHVAETTSGKNFSDFFNQWYYGEGFPTFNITYLMQGTDSIVLIVNQTVSAPLITPFFKGLYEMKITSAQGDTTVKIMISYNDQAFKFKYNKLPNGIVVDPNNWVLNATGTITNGGVLVPVILTSFSGYSNQCRSFLKWQAPPAQLIRQFEIEHSINGRDYTRAGTVAAANSETQYNFMYDDATETSGYFRLKIIAENGQTSYSQVIKIDNTCADHFSALVTPNPAKGKVTAKVFLPEDAMVTLQVVNSIGAVMYNKVQVLHKGENHILLEKSERLANGNYILKAVYKTTIISRPFIKL